jgi:hypothetical protein
LSEQLSSPTGQLEDPSLGQGDIGERCGQLVPRLLNAEFISAEALLRSSESAPLGQKHMPISILLGQEEVRVRIERIHANS